MNKKLFFTIKSNIFLANVDVGKLWNEGQKGHWNGQGRSIPQKYPHSILLKAYNLENKVDMLQTEQYEAL